MGDKITVAAGQTLSQIAVQYGVSVEALQKANDIDNVDSIKAGQEITIPIGQKKPEQAESKDDLNYERQKLHYMD